jgi:plasmid maintenance system antidote protein VapI
MKTKKRGVFDYPPLPKQETSEEWIARYPPLSCPFQLVKDLMYLDDLTPDQMMKETGMPVKYIVEIIERERRITTGIASLFERYFGWPAQVLLTWQLLYDIKNELYRQEDRLREFEWHVYNQEIFLVCRKNSIRMLKKDRAFLKKLLPARFRSMR